MSRRIWVLCLHLGVSGWASVLTNAGIEDRPSLAPSTLFPSFLGVGKESYTAQALWDRLLQEHVSLTGERGGAGPSRELGRPTAEQSIVWAVSRTQGPVQALAVIRMPDLEEETPLLVDFRNMAAPERGQGSLASVSPAFLGETPEPPGSVLLLSGLAFLGSAGIVRRFHRHRCRIGTRCFKAGTEAAPGAELFS